MIDDQRSGIVMGPRAVAFTAAQPLLFFWVSFPLERKRAETKFGRFRSERKRNPFRFRSGQPILCVIVVAGGRFGFRAETILGRFRSERKRLHPKKNDVIILYKIVFI